MIGMLASIGSDQVAIGTVSGLLIAFSAAILKLYGSTQEERKASAEDRVSQVEEELERARSDYAKDRIAWEAERARYEEKIDRLIADLLRCWQDQRRRLDDPPTGG